MIGHTVYTSNLDQFDLRSSMFELFLLLRPGRGAEYCDQFVRLSVCLSVREHISGTPGPIFTKFCVQVPCGRGSVLVWRRCDTGRSLMSMNASLRLKTKLITIHFVVHFVIVLSSAVILVDTVLRAVRCICLARSNKVNNCQCMIFVRSDSNTAYSISCMHAVIALLPAQYHVG